MSKLFKNIGIVLSLIFAFFVLNCASVEAKKVSSDIFEVEVGMDNKLPIYYSLDDEEGTIVERISFKVVLKGLETVGKEYSWEHSFCYAVNGGPEICEVDVTSSKEQENPQRISSSQKYEFTFWDGDMGHYADSLLLDYVVFKNKLTCIETGVVKEVVLDDIMFGAADIDYGYQFDIDMKITSTVDDRKYIENYYNGSSSIVYLAAVLKNNIYSEVYKDNVPTFVLRNEICVGTDDCKEQLLENVETVNDEIPLNPYIGNISFYYFADNLKYNSNALLQYSSVKIKTTLECKTNCNGRIPSTKVLLDDTFYFDQKNPVVDTENTSIESVDDYVKSVNITISVKDDESGLATNGLYYDLIRPYTPYCSEFGEYSRYTYENGVEFTIGSQINDGAYCMKYYAEDKNGNVYASDYYILYIDNNGPSLTVNKGNYNDSNYYNQIDLSVMFTDAQSGFKEGYYLWSKNIIEAANYLTVKETGLPYDNNGNLSSKDVVSEEGAYYLYFLGYDNLDNYKFYYSGKFKFDFTPLANEEIELVGENVNDYGSNPSVMIKIDQIPAGETFKCGFFSVNRSISLEELTYVCENNKAIALPSTLEGQYNLWIYTRDRANNYSLIMIDDVLKIDTKGPGVNATISKDDDLYHITNEIILNLVDLNGLNQESLKYGWALANKSNVDEDVATMSFANGETIGYPVNTYGEYKLYVAAEDTLGNKTFTSLNKIFKIDTAVIRISLVGEEVIKLIRGQTYQDEGAVAFKGDVSSGGRTSEVTVHGEVDYNKKGTYTLTYSSGEGDLLVTVTRKIIIEDDTPYLVISISLFVICTLLFSLRYFVFNERRD